MTSWRMQPTAVSALGVIAIVTVMITLTASEAESGTLEQRTRLPIAETDIRNIPKEDTPESNGGNSNSTFIILFRKNDTASETESARDEIHVYSDHTESMNLTDTRLADLQRDQSADELVLADRRTHPEGNYGRTEQPLNKIDGENRGGNGRTKTETEASDPVELGSTEDSADSSIASAKRELDTVQVNVDGLPSIGRDFEPPPTSPKNENTNTLIESTALSVEPAITLATELRPIEQKNVEDIKAISFQVPLPVPANPGDAERKSYEDVSGKSDTKKDQSRGLNNIVSGKSTKAFYEIKPSIKTEMEVPGDRQATFGPQTHTKYGLPKVDSAIGKYGPYFEDGDQEINITARIGSTVLLDCKIGMLGDKKVTWLQHSKDSFRLLTVGRTPYSNDQRISLNFRYPINWRLQILFASPRDSGLYKCQIATHPPLIKEINVIVTAPELTITDDSGRLVSKERHLKAGSALKLKCEARDVREALNESVIWTRGDETLLEDVSENRTTETSGEKEILVIVSTLTVERATPRHAGNYSCVVPGKARTSIAVHVLNGELPAAVHDGNGVSRAFLNLWLIHLTMSYVFSR